MCLRPRYGKTFKKIFGWTVLICIVVRLFVALGPDVKDLLDIMINAVIGGIVLGAMLGGIVTLSMWIAYRFFH